MTEHEHDPLWNPRADGDADLKHIERQLSVFAATNRLALRQATSRVARRWPRVWMALAASLVLAVVAAWHLRLSWPENRAWETRIVGADGIEQRRALLRDQLLVTGVDETAYVDVARIGDLTVAPETTLRLLTTRSGRHRIALERGRIDAVIWAPPGQFGIESGAAEIIDLGCAFTLTRDADGQGLIAVRSGWVQYELGREEVLLPAGYAMRFDDEGAAVPLRDGVDAGFRDAVLAFDLARGGDRDVAAMRVAEHATAPDAFTLLHLLTRERALAAGPLYARLGELLGVAADPAHRARWAAGDDAAVEAWWDLWPVPPKAWWRQWRDAWPSR